MTYYHVNPVTGNVGQCHASYENSCPFGRDEDHTQDPASARALYEKLWEKKSFTSVRKVTVLRAGTPVPPDSYSPELLKLMEAIDSRRPEGRTPREGAIFASPNYASHRRWLRNRDTFKVTLKPERVFIYPVAPYERAVMAFQQLQKREDPRLRQVFEEATKEYWESAMPLQQWETWAAKAQPPAGTWEVIFDSRDVISSRKVATSTVQKAIKEDGHALSH